MLTASCHCGAVQIELAHGPQTLIECNCSICHRYGARWAHYTRETAQVLCGPEAVGAYLWGDREIEFYHCNTCGCVTHYECVDKLPDSRISVNARNLPLSEIERVPVRHFDGASSWEFLD